MCECECERGKAKDRESCTVLKSVPVCMCLSAETGIKPVTRHVYFIISLYYY